MDGKQKVALYAKRMTAMQEHRDQLLKPLRRWDMEEFRIRKVFENVSMKLEKQLIQKR